MISDKSWICRFSTEMCKQLNSYNGFPLEKVCKELPWEGSE